VELSSGRAPVSAKRANDAERQEPDERGPAPEIVPILAVEGARVAQRVVGGWIALGAGRAAAALAAPAHHVAFARESKAMAEEPAADHREPAYSGRAAP
jgi:hypothetical protein